MDWLRRGRRQPTPPEPEPEHPPVSEAAAPGVAALLDGVAADGSQRILDLGPGVARSLAVYTRFSRIVRFADVPGFLASPQGRGSPSAMAEAVPSHPDGPYDLIFGWDVLDRLYPEYRAPLIERLARVTGPGARLHVVLPAADDRPRPPLRFMLLDVDRMGYRPVGPPASRQTRLMPAGVAALLEPFKVAHGFTLKSGFREYVAHRPR